MEQNELNILIATGLYPPDIGGPATYSRMLEEKLHTHGIATVILPFGTVRHLPKVVRHLSYAWKLWKLSKDVDIVYALDTVSVGLPALVVSALRRKPFIVRLGGDYAWEQGQQRFGLAQTLDEYTHSPQRVPFMVKLLAFVQSFVVSRAHTVVAPSEYLKSIIASWGIRKEKIVVIYSALFPLQIREDKESIREQLSYKGTVIASVGRLVPWKGFSELIEAVYELRKHIPNAALVIIGDGPEEEALKRKIEEKGMQEHVRLTGKLSKDALGAAIKGADLFVLNTSYEGLSHQLLEVMELGIPIVTTNIGGNPELINDGISGLLLPAHDNAALLHAMVHVLENKDLQVRLVQHARLRTKDFNQDVVVAKLAELLRTVVNA